MKYNNMPKIYCEKCGLQISCYSFDVCEHGADVCPTCTMNERYLKNVSCRCYEAHDFTPILYLQLYKQLVRTYNENEMLIEENRNLHIELDGAEYNIKELQDILENVQQMRCI